MRESVSLAESGFSSGVSHITVTMDAVLHLAVGFRWEHVINKVVMAVQTRVLCNTPVAFFDLDRFVEVTRRECEGMEEAVVGFGQPLSTEVVREMTVVAGRDAVVARLGPSVVVGLHDMAVGARCRVVFEVRGALAVPESKGTKPTQDTQH